MGFIAEAQSNTRPFTAGSVLGRSFSIFLSNLGAFALMTVIVTSPVIVFAIYLATSLQEGDDIQTKLFTLAGVLTAGAFCLRPLAAAMVTYGVLQQLRGKHASFAECFRMGLSRMFPVIGVGLAAGILSLLGTLACLIPGVLATLAFWVATPAAVVERLGVEASLRRSADLTRGHRATLFGVAFVIGGADRLLDKILELVFLAEPITVEGLQAYILGITAFSVVTETLGAVAGAVAYNDLRTQKEGLDTETIASVFD
ncbi:hypothetical protein ACMHYB_59070 [Sorangium sp. So ce1128]